MTLTLTPSQSKWKDCFESDVQIQVGQQPLLSCSSLGEDVCAEYVCKKGCQEFIRALVSVRISHTLGVYFIMCTLSHGFLICWMVTCWCPLMVPFGFPGTVSLASGGASSATVPLLAMEKASLKKPCHLPHLKRNTLWCYTHMAACVCHYLDIREDISQFVRELCFVFSYFVFITAVISLKW